MQSIEQPGPLVMTGNVAERWEKFKCRFKIYLSAIGLRKDKDEDKKIAVFLHVAGDDAIEFLSTVEEEDDRNTLEKVLTLFDKHCIPKKNVTMERYRFNIATQGSEESIQNFVTRLKLLAVPP
jgi:hypothetical protein